MADRRAVTQVVDGAGQARRAYEQPGWFLTNTADKLDEAFDATGVVRCPSMPDWGEVFGVPNPGHDVEFFVNGASYFRSVAQAIRGATQSVFIAGWQVNYAVEMGGGATLLSCLDQAVENGATVYVMPWLAPPGPVDTGYLQTMMAVLHLNGGQGLLSIKRRKGAAYCLPALAQSDMSSLNAFFSHHQKLVVVDNKKAYVGGIDLAYGRRESGSYSLHAEGRKLKEFYSPNIPPIKEPTAVELRDTTSLLELIVAGLVPKGLLLRKAVVFPFTPADGPFGVFAHTIDLFSNISDYVGEKRDKAKDVLDKATNALDEFTGVSDLKDAAVEHAEGAMVEGIDLLWGLLPEERRSQIRQMYESGGREFREAVNLMWDLLRGVDVSRLPYRREVFDTVGTAVHALVGVLVSVGTNRIGAFQRYDRLFESPCENPGSTRVHDPEQQPRQPWHDVHCALTGPAVYDLGRNFTQRWNALARQYRDENATYRSNKLTQLFMMLFNIFTPERVNVMSIKPAHVPPPVTPGMVPNTGNWVQVLRSAPTALLKAENGAGAGAGARRQAVDKAQNNCLKAMVKAIHGAQQFIYIEGQFFQSDHSGYMDHMEPGQPLSGPAGAMVSIRDLEGYERYAELLGIKDVPVNAINPSQVRWRNTGKVLRDPEYDAFERAVRQVLSNHETITAVDLLEASSRLRQNQLINPICKALGTRIERAINEGNPFHVYLVVPVHPEGKLDEITLMRQVDLTMQSLVHGTQSLVNCVRRALVARHEQEHGGLSEEAAVRKARGMLLEELLDHDAGEDWPRYVTLLNLRTHAVAAGGRPVTEQIYVHSKLLVADDNVAVLGSANINDRSLLGGRDSELAVIVAGGERKQVKLDGVRMSTVSARVHGLRTALWRDIFGEKARGGVRPATGLLTPSILEQPAAESTVRAIRERASANAKAYEDAFAFIPRNSPSSQLESGAAGDKKRTAALWPTWNYPESWWLSTRIEGVVGARGKLQYRMPFDPLFWRPAQRADDEQHPIWGVSYDRLARPKGVAGIAAEAVPRGVQGFIVALPTGWVAKESNNTGFALSVLANADTLQGGDGEMTAQAAAPAPDNQA